MVFPYLQEEEVAEVVTLYIRGFQKFKESSVYSKTE